MAAMLDTHDLLAYMYALWALLFRADRMVPWEFLLGLKMLPVFGSGLQGARFLSAIVSRAQT